MRRAINIKIGDRFGAWEVISEEERDTRSRRRWLCRCLCGTELVIRQVDLASTRSNQCRRCGNADIVTWRGVTMTTRAWAYRLGVSQQAYRRRRQLGWTMEKTLSTGVDPAKLDAIGPDSELVLVRRQVHRDPGRDVQKRKNATRPESKTAKAKRLGTYTKRPAIPTVPGPDGEPIVPEDFEALRDLLGRDPVGTRAACPLYAAGITTLDQAATMSEAQLNEMLWLGPTGVKRIKEVLARKAQEEKEQK